ncbi:MAG: hypothetical protein HC926_00295 [Synechococcaceae cyanobacterium SM2_3_60]|nr:hypothetical protein [Synechococcaceae cyanobacterium SM2_3_60]
MHPKHSTLLIIIIVFISPFYLLSQNQPGTPLAIKRAQGKIVLDGILDEQDWLGADVADDWYQNFPVDTARAAFQTEARLTFDDEFLYVSFVCYDDDTPDINLALCAVISITTKNDNVGFSLGPYNDKLNGFFLRHYTSRSTNGRHRNKRRYGRRFVQHLLG